jgi:hypothetical protein
VLCRGNNGAKRITRRERDLSQTRLALKQISPRNNDIAVLISSYKINLEDVAVYITELPAFWYGRRRNLRALGLLGVGGKRLSILLDWYLLPLFKSSRSVARSHILRCLVGFEGVKVVVERGSLNCSSPLRLARHSC